MTAKYWQIVDWIEKRIDSGELRKGDRIESENEICSRLGLSRQTVRHALGVLEQRGKVSRVRGSGTYVGPAGEKSVLLQNKELAGTVTIMSTYTDGYIFPRLLREMVNTLRMEGYETSIVFTENRIGTEREFLLRILREESRNPLIAEPVKSGLPNPNLELYRELQDRGIPVLFFHSYYEGIDIPCVRMDDIEAGRLAAEHLIGLGHRKIAGFFKLDDGQGKRRYMGYAEALLRNGLELTGRRICWADTLETRHFSIMEEKLSERLSDCTACVCYNDEIAHMLTDYLAAKGISVPNEFSLVSIDNSELANLNSVPLTSVSHPMEALGRKTAKNMIHLIRDPGFDASYIFPVSLTERGSALPLTEE